MKDKTKPYAVSLLMRRDGIGESYFCLAMSINQAANKNEALGKAIEHHSKSMPNHSVAQHLITEITINENQDTDRQDPGRA